MSPERINREVLKALKEWDPFVFKRSQPCSETERISPSKWKSSGKNGGFPLLRQKMSPENENKNESSDFPQNLNESDEKEHADHMEEDHAYDDLKLQKKLLKSLDPRPQQKVILLSGPPGTGKSTLASIIAKHCGYRPYEINASDDRSVEKLQQIFSSLQSNTLSLDRRPNCLILDEIDGIDNRNSIELIVNIIKEPLVTRPKGHEDEASRRSSKSSSKSLTLTRPIICICNDLYAPALKELRKHSRVFAFQYPTEIRLIQRLKQICLDEELSVTTSTLTKLCSATGNDVRSTLNTLQFATVRSKQRQNLKYMSKYSLNIDGMIHDVITSGVKDDQYNGFQLWKMIFCQRDLKTVLARKRVQLLNKDEPSKDMNDASMMNEVINAMKDFHDDELIISGCFENRLKVLSSDPLLVKSDLVSDWFSFIDTLQHFSFK